jgi:hypothetical protein
MEQIEIDVVTTSAALDEAFAISATRQSWLRRAIEYGYMTIYVIVPSAVLGWFGVRGAIAYVWGPGQDVPRFLFSVGAVAIPVCLVAFFLRNLVRARRTKSSFLGPRKFSFTAEGISGTAPNGAPFRTDWASYSGFCATNRSIICPKRDASEFLIIPIEGLPPGQTSGIRSLLARYLPELDPKALRASLK